MIYKERLKEWLDQTFDSVEKNISCRELMDQLPAHIEALVQGQSTNGKFADLDQHLAVCSDCSELYEELVHLAELEKNGRLPEIDELLVELAGEEAAVPTF